MTAGHHYKHQGTTPRRSTKKQHREPKNGFETLSQATTKKQHQETAPRNSTKKQHQETAPRRRVVQPGDRVAAYHHLSHWRGDREVQPEGHEPWTDRPTWARRACPQKWGTDLGPTGMPGRGGPIITGLYHPIASPAARTIL